MALDVVAKSRCFGGTQYTYQHQSSETGTPMRFAAFVAPQADKQPVPVVWYLSGLTCTEENLSLRPVHSGLRQNSGCFWFRPTRAHAATLYRATRQAHTTSALALDS